MDAFVIDLQAFSPELLMRQAVTSTAVLFCNGSYPLHQLGFIGSAFTTVVTGY
jgi:hypothetical protein